MPCTDADLEKYINLIKKAKNEGVNIATVIDYKLIDGTTQTFQNGKTSYTTGVFLEERAKGNQMPEYHGPAKSSNDLWNYCKVVKEYIDELEKKASVDQSIYDKFLQDYLRLNELSITPDPKPSNFFFDEKEGYTIIDVIDIKNNTNEFLVRYIFSGVFGYGLPVIYLSNENYYSFINTSLYKRYEEACRLVFEKVINSAKKYGIETKYLIEDLKNTSDKCFANTLIVRDSNLNIFIENYDFESKKER